MRHDTTQKKSFFFTFMIKQIRNKTNFILNIKQTHTEPSDDREREDRKNM